MRTDDTELLLLESRPLHECDKAPAPVGAEAATTPFIQRFLGKRAILASFLPFACCLACTQNAADVGVKADRAPVAVTVVSIAPATVSRSVPVVGTLDPFKDIQLATKVDGRVLRVARDTGDAVLPGDILLELDAREYQLEAEAARQALEAELARLELSILPPAGTDLEQLVENVPTVAKARATLEEGVRKVEQQRTLFDKGVGSKEDLAVVSAERKVAEATLRQVKTEARAALASTRRLRAALDQAEQRLRDAILRAPVPDDWPAWAALVGPAANPLRYTVAQRMVWEGEMVRGMPEKNAFRLVIAHILKLRTAVPEKHAREIETGRAAVIRVDGLDRTFPGLVTRVSPTVDPLNRTFQVEIEVPNGTGPDRLKPGMFARAEIQTRTDIGVLTVPAGAVATFAGVHKVFVVDGDRARAVEVHLGRRDGELVEGVGKIPAGAKVIATGLGEIVDGSLVRVR